ncbi:DUF4286 family protein [Streptomyces sp. NPDC048277]|uniref:DUF4286 family protein n=1 Tax=Streptomyces sp. NPDC048277 TaxID=3155027 RepID=UPI0033DDF9AF
MTTEPVSQDTEAAYNEWYDKVHIPEVLALPGFVSARRLRAVADPSKGDGAQRYLAIYEIDAPDITDAAAALASAAPGLTLSEAIAFDRTTTVFFEELPGI